MSETKPTSAPRTGRPPKLRPADEHQMYLMHKAGVSIRTCAGFFRVSRATANRVLARQRNMLDSQVEPLAREFRAKAREILEST